MNFTLLFTLFIVYQHKHLIADYFLQGRYMLGKFLRHPHYIKPLLAHVGVHALFTLVIAAFVKPKLAIPLALLDASIHFVVDRLKASPDLGGKYKFLSASEYNFFDHQKYTFLEMLRKDDVSEFHKDAALDAIAKIDRLFSNNAIFWQLLGVDQYLHHMTHYLIIYMLVK